MNFFSFNKEKKVNAELITLNFSILQFQSPKIQAVHDSQAIMRISRCGLEIAIAASCTGRLL